jgi:hypothetical protein
MSKNEFLTQYDQCLEDFCYNASNIWENLKVNTKLKKSDIVSITFSTLADDSDIPGLFRSSDYPSIQVCINMKNPDNNEFSTNYLILCYPNCCGIAILYGLEYIGGGFKYDKQQNTTATLFLLKEICSLLGYGSCQYVCTSYLQE